MNTSKSLLPESEAVTAAPPAPQQGASGGVAVSRLLARMFGATKEPAQGATFAKTQWQDTEWQDTRSLPRRT